MACAIALHVPGVQPTVWLTEPVDSLYCVCGPVSTVVVLFRRLYLRSLSAEAPGRRPESADCNISLPSTMFAFANPAESQSNPTPSHEQMWFEDEDIVFGPIPSFIANSQPARYPKIMPQIEL